MEQANNTAEINLGSMGEAQLLDISRKMLLSLDLNEMKKIKEEFIAIGRSPTDAELETIAQTWSEHCKHKVFNCTIDFDGPSGKETIESLFRTYIAGATEKIAKEKKGMLVSVFSDNAGVIAFNRKYDICMKVETHNHPSALEPYGGANTGVGGVIRDVLGCGLGAKPIANTDVFCFAEPWTDASQIPKGVLHPKRIFKGVRAGVRDYGNRMGIPTVNGAIIFDKRYLGNPLVYCGTVGLLPRGMHKKEAAPKELIVVVGARTGKDGLHGATFSSAGLEENSPVSAVQIGNAIEERKVMDALLRARDEGLYTCITDCGAGGFSSAIGEMGAETGARVELDKAPLKYKGMKPWEIWLSESQERMIISVPKKNLKRLMDICEVEEVEAAVVGEFTKTGRLEVFFGRQIIDLDMEFLHKGVPGQRRTAKYIKPIYNEPHADGLIDYGNALHEILKMPNVASKERTVRQYDHEVQGGAVLKPFVGIGMDAPSDAAIVRPLLDSNEAVVIANGINSMYGDISSYWMAASCIDEAIRNAVAVGADPGRIALLDNFSWGNPDKPIKLAELVLACKACHDIAIEFETPFISGKDSLYNEFDSGNGRHISIPGTLLISSIAVMDDSGRKVSMDLKEIGNTVYVLGKTCNELGGSHYYRIFGNIGNRVPKVNASAAKKMYSALHKAMMQGNKNSDRIVRSCHDCSEGGIAVAAAEMCFGGNIGMEIDLSKIPQEDTAMSNDVLLFSESNSRFVVEVKSGREAEFEKIMKGCDFAAAGKTVKEQNLVIRGADGKVLIKEKVAELKKSWKGTLDW